MLKTVNIPMFEHPNTFSALAEEVEAPLEFLSVLGKHKLEKFSVAISSESEDDDLGNAVSKMEYAGVPTCYDREVREPPGFRESPSGSDNDAEEEHISRSTGNRSKRRVASTKFRGVDGPSQNPNMAGTSVDGGEVHDSAQENKNERQSKDIEELWEKIIEKQKTHPCDPVQTRIEWERIRKRHLDCDGKLQIQKKTIPGYRNPSIQRRREKQAGYRKWMCDLWTGVKQECVDQCCIFEQTTKNWRVRPGEEISEKLEGQYPCDGDKIENHLSILGTVEPEGINTLDDLEWEELELAVDSGATETVIGEESLQSIKLLEGAAYKRGVKYEVANGIRIPNLGEKRFVGVTEEGLSREIVAQVCEVNKPLLSVSKIVAAGNRVVFDENGSYIENIASGEKVWMKSQGGMYMLKMYVKKGF